MKYHYEDWLKVKVEFDGLEVGCKGLCVGWEEPGHDVYPPEGEDEIVEIRIDMPVPAQCGKYAQRMMLYLRKPIPLQRLH